MSNYLNPKNGLPERSALDLIEEAVHLLRCAPLRILLFYAVGTLPFIVGMLFFCLEVRVASNSWDIIVPGSLVLTLLYVWMGGWQAAFTQELWALRLGRTPPVWTWRTVASLTAAQTRWKPWGLFALPLSAIFLVPWPWCYMLSHNISILITGETGSATERTKGIAVAMRLASQNWKHAFKIQVFGHVLYGLMYFNLMLLLLAFNLLVHLISGIESPMNENPFLYVSVPVQLAVCGLTFFFANPIMKTVCMLRCLYGLSRDTGDDLLAGLRNARARIAAREERNRIHAPIAPAAARPGLKAVARLITVAFLFLTTITATTGGDSAHAADQPKPAASAAANTAPSVDTSTLEKRSQEIGRSMERVFASPDYSWRDDNEVKIKTVQNHWFKRWTDYLWSWVEWFYKPRKDAADRDEASGNSFWSFLQYGNLTMTQALMLIGALGCLIAICIFLLRKTKQEPQGAVLVPVPAAPPAVNVADEQVLASALPEDEWRALAEKLRMEGNLRLALRALYLGTLAHLARRELISIARAKSVRNYRRELQMKARHIPPVLTAFDAQAQDFERIWYGEHPSTSQLFETFLQRHGNIEVASHV
ncbi:MAG: DUF4129 domain-containing protein [Candidatus Methylacidiphilales bacterium]